MCTENPSIYDENREPRLFSEILGHVVEKRRLTRTIASDQVPRIIYFTGPTGVGKTAMGRLTALSVKCLNRPRGTHEPCGKCKNCIAILNESLMEYEEVSADQLTDEYIRDLKFELRREDNVIFIDELQDASQYHQRQLRSVLKNPKALIIFATTHRHSIEDTLFNRLKSYEYQLRRPSVQEGCGYLAHSLTEFGVEYRDENQLVRIVTGLNREMRPCAEFPRKVVAEAGGKLTDEYLDDLFGKTHSVEISATNNDQWIV